MLTEKNIQEAEAIAQKNEAVKKLLDFYNDCQSDGIKAFGISLNKKLIVLSRQIDDADIDLSNIEDRVFDRIFKAMTDGGKIAENLKAINRADESGKKHTPKGHENKIIM